MDFFKGILTNNPTNFDPNEKQAIIDSSENEPSDSEVDEVDEIESSQKYDNVKMATEEKAAKIDEKTDNAISQEPSETPRSSKKRKISETADDNADPKIDGLTDRAVLEKIWVAVDGGDKKNSKRFKAHAKTLNTLKINDEILNMEVQSLKQETVNMRKYFTNKLHQMNRDVNTMKFEESNVIIYDLKMSDLQPLIKHNNVSAAVQKFGLNFIRRYIEGFKEQDFKATKLEQEGEAEDGGDKWRMMLRLASTHYAQVLMWRMRQRKHWNFRGGLSKLSRDQANLIEEEVKRKNAKLDKDSEEMFKRKFINKIAVVKRSDPHKTVRFIEPFDPKPFAKSKIELGTRLVEHEADITVDDSEDEEEEDGSDMEDDSQQSILVSDTPNLSLQETAKTPDSSNSSAENNKKLPVSGSRRLSKNGIPLGRPPGAKTNDASKIKKSNQTSGASASSSKSSLRTLTSFKANATRKNLREGLEERDTVIAQQQAQNEKLTRELEKLRAEKQANSSSETSRTA